MPAQCLHRQFPFSSLQTVLDPSLFLHVHTMLLAPVPVHEQLLSPVQGHLLLALLGFTSAVHCVQLVASALNGSAASVIMQSDKRKEIDFILTPDLKLTLADAYRHMQPRPFGLRRHVIVVLPLVHVQ